MRWLWTLVLGLVALSGVFQGTALGSEPQKAADEGCGNHGTTIHFLDTPSKAATQAKKEGKLVFVLHVSGNFEDPRFT
jgi:hypothetical protein